MSTLEWTTPSRKLGMKVLATIPSEIYLEILLNVRFRIQAPRPIPSIQRDLFSIAFVCKFFFSIVVPWFYGTLELNIETGTPSGDGPTFRRLTQESFCMAIFDESQLAIARARAVKKLSLSVDRSPWSSGKPLLPAFCVEALTMMSNIQELSLSRMFIDRDLMETILDFPLLRRLTIKHCRHAFRNDRSPPETALLPLHIEELSIFDTFTGTIPFFANYINFGVLLKLHTNSSLVLSELSQVSGLLSLDTLHIWCSRDHEFLISILEKALRLKSFRTRLNSGPLPLPRKALPQLEDVLASPGMLPLLLQGRPVTSVRLDSTRSSDIVDLPSIPIYKFSSCPIFDVGLDGFLYGLLPFWEHFPDTRRLKIKISVPFSVDGSRDAVVEDELSRFIGATQLDQPPLETLLFSFALLGKPYTSLDLQRQFHWVHDLISPAFPALQECQISKYIVWLYKKLGHRYYFQSTLRQSSRTFRKTMFNRLEMPTIATGDKVLVSGANGYIAMWVIRHLLERGYVVRGTVRSESKGKFVREYFTSLGFGDKLELVIVENIEKEGAFDQAVKDVDAIAHTASPCHHNVKDPNEFFRPAIQGTVGMLKSAFRYGSKVKRIVVTSSCGAVITASGKPRTFSEDDWNTVSPKEVEEKGSDASPSSIYRASKTLAEQAAWKFYEEHKSDVKWDLTVIHPSFVFGPPIHDVGSPASLNTSMERWYDTVIANTPKTKESLAYSSGWVDVRDTALAHVLALEKEAAGGERIITAAGSFNFQEWINVANSLPSSVYPNHKLPTGFPELFNKDTVYNVVYNKSKEERILKIKFHTKEETTMDILEDFAKRGW